MNYRNIILHSLFLCIAAWFTVWQRQLAFPLVSSIMTILLALPAIIGCVRWLGINKSYLVLSLLGVFAYAIETLGLLTGFPYGAFSYSANVGILLFDFIPLTLPFAWIPLLLGAYTLGFRKDRVSRFAWTIGYLVTLDIVLDPGAVLLHFWSYTGDGIWYGVPLSNFVGWIVSGSIGYILVSLFAKRTGKPSPLLFVSYWYAIIFWTSISLFGQLWGAAIVGFVLVLIVFPKLKRAFEEK